MSECPNLKNCPFFKQYETNEQYHKLLTNFIRLYCKGEKKFDCVRLRLKNKYGKEKVPTNMMPNGMALKDTKQEDWSPEIKKAAKEH